MDLGVLVWLIRIGLEAVMDGDAFQCRIYTMTVVAVIVLYCSRGGDFGSGSWYYHKGDSNGTILLFT